MASVLYIMYGMPSCYNSGLAFAQRFATSNISLTVACDQDISGPARGAGLAFHHLQSLSQAESSRQFDAANRTFDRVTRGPLRTISLVRARLALRRQSLADDSLLRLIDELNPDVLLIDIECHLAIIASSTLNRPTALCSRLFDHRPAASRPPLHTERVPGTGLPDRIRIMMAWWKLRGLSCVVALRQSVSVNRLRPIHYRSSSMVDIKAIARRYGVHLWSIATAAHWFRPVCYRHAPILSMTLAELDFNGRSDDGFRYIGPMIDQQDFAFPVDNAAGIDGFVSHATSLQQRIVYCAMGTYACREPRFVAALLELAHARKDLALIISLGGRELPHDYPAFPANALLLASAPQLKCLAQADVAILHAGIASLQEALKLRVPALIFSVGSNDQNGNAVRWVHNNIARRFWLDSASANVIGGELDRLLNDTQLAQRLEQYGRLADQRYLEFSPEKLIGDLLAA